MKITLDPSDKELAFVTSLALTKSMSRLVSEIAEVSRKRSLDDANKAMRVQSMRSEYRNLKNIQEQLDLARRLAGFLV